MVAWSMCGSKEYGHPLKNKSQGDFNVGIVGMAQQNKVAYNVGIVSMAPK